MYGNDSGAEKKLTDSIPDVFESLKGRRYLSVWYNPLGFYTDGRPRTKDDPDSGGFRVIFWDSAKLAASSRLERESESIERYRKIVEMRRSKYQLHSIRRQLSLLRARKEYSHCVVRMFSSEKLFELCR